MVSGKKGSSLVFNRVLLAIVKPNQIPGYRFFVLKCRKKDAIAK